MQDTTMVHNMMHTVYIHYTSSVRQVGEDLSLAHAKRLARQAWDRNPGMYAEICREDGSVWTASQSHGRGMLWT